MISGSSFFTRSGMGPFPSAGLCDFYRLLQLCQPRRKVLHLDSFDGEIKDTLRRPESDCRRYLRISHKLQDGYASSACSLLHPGGCLIHYFSPCLEISSFELRQPQPTQEGLGCDVDRMGSLLDRPMR